MPRHAPKITCTPETKAELTAIARSRSEDARLVERSRIILKCLEGKQLQQVAKDLEITVPTVRKWRQRFAKEGWRRFIMRHDLANHQSMTQSFETACFRFLSNRRLRA